MPGAVAGVPPLVWRVHGVSTAGWPEAAAVDRQAFAASVSDPRGETYHSVVVYLRRGRLVVGVYFNNTDGTPSVVTGATTIGATVGLFQRRMAELPASDVR